MPEGKREGKRKKKKTGSCKQAPDEERKAGESIGDA